MAVAITLLKEFLTYLHVPMKLQVHQVSKQANSQGNLVDHLWGVLSS